MRFRTLLAALAVFSLIASAAAEAAPKHSGKVYVLHGKKCQRGYKRVKRPAKTLCIKQSRKAEAPLAPLTRTTKLAARLSNFTRDPLNPFKVNYGYGASATQDLFQASVLVADDQPAEPPAGVLALYSDGILECANNVGGSTATGECPVSYQALGSHRVTTIYTSGSESATVTEVKTIEPLPTTTSLSAHYVELPVSQTSGEYWWEVGALVIAGAVAPNGPAVQLTCGPTEMSACLVIPGQPQVQGSIEVPVLGRQCAAGPERNAEPLCDIKIGGDWLSVASIELGSYYLRGVSPNLPGYLSSEATTAVKFGPSLHFPGCDDEHTGPWC
jgi:hypothetical protein